MAFPYSSRTATTSVAGKNNPLSASSSTTLVSPPPMSIDIIGDIPPVADADDADEFRDLLKTMGDSVRSVREFSQGLIESQKEDPSSSAYPTGISLLTLKNQLLLSYIHNIIFLLLQRLRPSNASSAMKRWTVEELVKLRIVLEKIRPLEGKLKYQVDKLVRKAEEWEARGGAEGRGKGKKGGDEVEDEDVINDPLSFRPNPANLVSGRFANDSDDEDEPSAGAGGVYRPPKMAPVPYAEGTKGKRKEKATIPNAHIASLATTALTSASAPYLESTTGLSTVPLLTESAASSSRAKKLADMDRYEEDNFTRLVLKKRDMKRRRRDEEDLALGGRIDSSEGGKGRRKGGLEREFEDVLGAIEGGGRRRGGSGAGAGGDAFEGLRGMKRQRKGVGESAMGDTGGFGGETGEGGGARRKKGRFERNVGKLGREAGGKRAQRRKGGIS